MMDVRRLEGELFELQRWMDQTRGCIRIVAANPNRSALGAEEAIGMMKALLDRDSSRRDELQQQLSRVTL